MLNRHESPTRLLRVPRSAWAFVAGPIIAAVAALLPNQAFAVAPPANSIIQGQASAVYSDGNGQHHVDSNTVSTTVQQVFSHTLTSSQTVAVQRGDTAQLWHTLRNTGNGSDSYTLSTFVNTPSTIGLSSAGTKILPMVCGAAGPVVGAVAITAAVTVAANTDLCFLITADTTASSVGNSGSLHVGAAGTATGGTDLNNYTANATAATGAAQGNVDTINVVTGPTFTVVQSMTPSTGPGSPTGTSTITIDYKNTSPATTTATQLTITTALGRAAAALPNVSGTSFDTANLCYVPATAVDTLNGAITFPTTGTASTSCAGVNESGVLTLIVSAMGGQSGRLTFQVKPKNVAVGQEHATSVAQYAFGSPTTYGASNAVNYTVLTTGGVSDLTLTAFSGTSNTITTAIQGSTLSFPLKVTNTGTVSEEFDLTVVSTGATAFPAGTVFTFQNAGGANLQDTGPSGSAAPDTGSLPAGQPFAVTVRVDLPAKAITITSYTANVLATSSKDPSKSATIAITVSTVTPRTVDVAPGTTTDGAFTATIAAASAVTVNPADTATIAFSIHNTQAVGNGDSYNIEVGGSYTHSPTIPDGSVGALPTGWTYRVMGNGPSTTASCAQAGTPVVSTVIIAGGGRCDFVAEISIPAGNAPTSATPITIRATSNVYFMDVSGVGASSSEADYDAMKATVTVNTLASVVLRTAGTKSVTAGGSVVYGHQLCNVGNISSSNVVIVATNTNSTNFRSDIYTDANSNQVQDTGDTLYGTAPPTPLAVNACIAILDKVIVAATAAQNETNTTTLTVTATFTSGNVVTTQTDTTTVLLGTLLAEKFQGVIANPVAASAWPTMSKSALPPQLPGTVIAYQVSLTNLGTDPVTAITITDVVPNYTTLYESPVTACTRKLVVNGTTVSGSPVTQSGSTLTSSAISSLGPNQVATMTFCVKLDQ